MRLEPWVGLLLGGCLLVLGGVVIVMTAPKSDYYATPSIGRMLAPSMLLVGAGTLAVSAWFRVRGARSTGADTLSG